MIFELRQYTHRPGRRDDFLELLEGPLYDPLEAAGMDIVGVFRDLDDSDRTVWVRSFPDMAARLAALEEFYDSELWWSHRDAVNATLVDSDDVLLLRGLVAPKAAGEHGVYTAVVWPSIDPGDLATREETIALLETESSENDFPRLPVREGENVLVWVAAGDVETPQLGSEPIEVRRLSPTTRSALR